MYFNARSIYSKQTELLETLDNYNADIIAICETWLKDCHKLTAFNSNYNVFRQDRTSANGGGILLAVKNTLQCKLLNSMSINRCEVLFADVKFTNSEYIRYVVVYRPPDTNLDDSKELFKLIYENLRNIKHFLITGDLNLPDILWNTFSARTQISRDFLTLCFKLGALQCVDFPTRENNVLDLVLCSSKHLLLSIQCEPPFSSSDHMSIVCNIVNHYQYRPSNNSRPCFRKANYNLINAFLATIDWNEVYADCKCTSDYWLAFKTIVDTAIFNFVPFTADVLHKHVPWFKEPLKRLRSIKQRKWKKYIKNRNIVTYADYKSSANKFRSEFIKAKCTYEKYLFSNDNCTGKFFSYVRSQTSVRSSIPSIVKSDGKLAVTDYEKSCEFLKYFSSVFVQDNNILPDFNSNCNDKLEAFNCSPTDVIKVVKKLKNTSSTGPDGVSVLFLKNVLAQIVNPLCKVYNMSLDEGFLPDDWKTAHIIPILKKGSPQCTSQYRPISLTSVISKILERIVRMRLLDYLTKNNIIPANQHGFVPKKSTVTNLIECMNDWTLNFDKGVNTDVIYLDYSKCFDTVCHSKLLYKLAKYGIEGSAYKWLESFLLNRKQHVKINNCVSPAAAVESGVPQGTVLGPLLFLIYSADLSNTVMHSKLSMYADDTKLYKAINDENDCVLLQNDLTLVSEWANLWQMKLNPEKTKVLSIGNISRNYEYKLDNNAIEHVNHMKDVGVIIQSNLKFTMHCVNVSRKAYYVIKTIFTTFRNHDVNFYIKMYQCYARPVLEYSSQIWSPALKCNIDRTEKVQRYFTRRICTNNMTYNERLIYLKLDSLEARRIKMDLYLFYKVLSGTTCINIQDHYRFCNRSRANNSKQLYTYFSRTDKRKFFWVNRIVKNWNNLNEITVMSLNYNSFKNCLKNIVFTGRGSLYC